MRSPRRNRRDNGSGTATLLLVVVVFMSGVIVLVAGYSAASAAPRDVSSHAGGTPAVPTGRSAILPHLNAVPAFSPDDATSYVSTHAIPFIGTPQGAPAISRVAFLSDSAVTTLLGEDPGLAGDVIVCYVELRGQFTLQKAPHGAGSAPSSFSMSYEVFDARTGNLLMWGARP